MKTIIYNIFFTLIPCLAWAQYPSNSGHKITLGEQTTADGLVFRGYATTDTVAATSKITRANKQDTSAFLLLDTVTNLLWHYKIGSNGWSQAGGSTFDTTSIKYVNTYGTQTVNGAKTISGVTIFSNTTEAGNAASAPVTFLGGVGIAKNLRVGGSIVADGPDKSIATLNGGDMQFYNTGNNQFGRILSTAGSGGNIRFQANGSTNVLDLGSTGLVTIFNLAGGTSNRPVLADVNGSLSAPSTPLPVANGGTGSATQNFVDLTTTQSSIGGKKTFTSGIATTANIDGDPEGFMLTNISTGLLAESTLYVRNESNINAGIFFQTTGTNFTPIGGFLADQGTIGTGTLLSNGMAFIVRAAADMRFYTSGHTNERMRITSGGNVGIGTTSPGNLLTIKDKSQIGFRDEASNSTRNALQNYAYTLGYGDGLRIGEQYNAVSIAGNVGIGTTSPVYKLDIFGTVNTSLLALRSSVNPTSNDYIGIDFGVGNVNGNLPNRSSRILGFADGANDAIGLTFYTSNGAAPTEKMRITSTGNVGIGTTNPLGLLETRSTVGGTNNGLFSLYESSGTAPYFTFRKARGTPASPSAVQINDGMGDLTFTGYAYSSFNSAVVFRAYNHLAPGAAYLNGGLKILINSQANGGLVEYLNIISNGNTAIGDNLVPTERLHVGGNVRITGNVGIGVTTPTNAIDMVGQISITGATIASGYTKNISIRGAQNFTDDEVKTITGNNVTFIMVADNNTGAGALFFASYVSGTVVKIADPSNFGSVTDSDGFFCVYKSASTNTINLKNRLGSTKSITVSQITVGD